MAKALYRRVRIRARGRCEYCHMPEAFDLLPFQVDHVVAVKHGGLTVFENLALTCFSCNAHKGPIIAGINPLTGRIVRLFNPRKDRWSHHFRWRRGTLVGKTATGTVTISLLNINDPFRVATRNELMAGGDW
jgi:hypothetical protein